VLSTSVIERPLALLLVDTTGNVEGWEWGVSNRLLTVLARRGVALVEERAIIIADSGDLTAHAKALAAASCVVLIGRGDDLGVWQWLAANVDGPKLAVVCQWGDHVGQLANAVLKAPGDWAPIAVASESPVTPREGALFLLKFLTELHLHSDARTTGRMAWFASTKAHELLKRRRMTARFGLRT
jgi:hypothetical protein